jgi:hypothetical protein
MNRFLRRLAPGAAAVLMAMLTACGGSESSAAGGGDLSLRNVEPVSGATVAVPFTVRVESSAPLGPSESGKHHVHIWFDDNESDYVIVESDVVQITDAPAGQHTMHISLRNANHSPAGKEVTTPLTIGGGAPASPAPASSAPASPAPASSGGPGLDYDY